MQSLRQLADELNRERPARARQRPPARRHLAFRTAARRTGRGEPRMSRRARDLTVAGRRPRFGVAVMLAAPLLLTGTANAIAATSPAGHATAQDTVPAASPARFPDGAAAKTDGLQSSERAAREPAGPRASGQNAHKMAATPPALGMRPQMPPGLAPIAGSRAGPVTPTLVNKATRPAPPRPAAPAGKRYPPALIEWKLSAWPPQHCG